jgi:alanine dehydrogenase
MMDRALYLTEADVGALVDLNEAIDALQAALVLEAKSETLNIPKSLGLFGASGSLHSLGSAFPGRGLGGFKTWANTGTAGVAMMVVFDLASAKVVAILEAGVLGQLRTAAISGVATRALAAAGAADMALVGTGRQAMMQLAAVAAVRPLKRVRIFSPTAEKRRAFVDQARKAVPFAVEESGSVRAAVDGAEIVTLVTRAREPFVASEMLAGGAHLNAVGAILPNNAEFAQDVFGAAGLICVDSVAGVQENSSEFRTWLEADGRRAANIVPLSKILTSAPSRSGDGRITLFKAMGMGISDLAIAQLAIERARQRGVGLPMPDYKRSGIRWRVLETAQGDAMGGAQHV